MKNILVISVILLLSNQADAARIIPAKLIGQNDTHGQTNSTGFNTGPTKIAIDTTNHRLYVADPSNCRVLEFDLNTDNLTPVDATADHVLGQSNFTTTCPTVNPGASSTNIYGPQGLAYYNNKLYVADNGYNRVLIFDTSNLSDGMAASVVLGQASMTTSNIACKSMTMSGPSNLLIDSTNNRLFVSDSSNDRVLIFTNIGSLTNGAAASNFFGQTDAATTNFSSSASVCTGGVTQNKIDNPFGLALIGTTLWVVDNNNNRVVSFDTSSISNGENASNVLGQSSFTTNSTGTSSTTLNAPATVASSGNFLYVSDANNNRVMAWDTSSTSNGMAAFANIGQDNFTTGSSGTDTKSFSNPVGLAIVGDRILISDYSNNRVVFDDLLTSSVSGDATGKGSISKGTAKSGTTVTVTASNNPLSGTLSCSGWSQTSGSTCTISSTTSCSPTITCTSSGTPAFSYTASAVGVSDTGTASLTITDTAPTAALTGAATTSGQTIRSGTSVNLTCACTDADSDYTTCTVVQTSGTTVTLSSASSCSPTFTAGKRGDYAFSCTCNDGDNGTGSGTVTVTSANSPSTVTVDTSKSANTTCSCCDTCTLNSGITASDPDGDTLTYSWAVTTQATGTACSCPAALVDEGILSPTPEALTISNSDTATATFTPQNEGDYSFTLTVTDSGGGTTTQSVKKTIQAVDTTATSSSTASTSKDCSPTGSGGAGGCGLTDSDCKQ